MAGKVASQIAAITSMNLRNITERTTASVVALVGIAGVVMVLIGVLSIAAGFRAVLDQSGPGGRRDRPAQTAPPTRWAARSLNAQTRIIADAKETARDADGPIVSPELYVVVDVPLISAPARLPTCRCAASGRRRRSCASNFRIAEGRALHAGHVRSDRRPRREPSNSRA